jgi:hypothetical protein
MGEAIEGTTLGTNKRYWGGEEGDTIFCWILVGYLNTIILFFFTW